MVTIKESQSLATNIVKEVAELPDRSSPEDWPEAMLVTSHELEDIVLSALCRFVKVEVAQETRQS